MAHLVDRLPGLWQLGLFGLVPDFPEPVSSWPVLIVLWLVPVLVVLLLALSFLPLYIPGRLVLGVVVPVPFRVCLIKVIKGTVEVHPKLPR